MNLLFSVANNKAFIVSLQIPYELFLEKFYKSKEAIHTIKCGTSYLDTPYLN